MQFSHDYFMRQALQEATYAYEEDEVPVGALVVVNNRVIGKGYNQTEKLKDVTAHAEMLAITAAASYLGSKFLDDCTLYVTLEPCLMCAAAMRWARVGTVVYGASDEKAGYTVVKSPVFHPKTQVVKGVLEHDCSILLKEFFKQKR
jgi:tRNA(adenine34) deaminase